MKYIIFSISHITRVVGILAFTVFLLGAAEVTAQCEGSLSVEKNRNSRSADEDGAMFWLELKNTSSRSQTYMLSYETLKEACGNAAYGERGPNVTLNVAIGEGQQRSNGYTVRAGQTARVMVLVTVPEGTPINRWSCIEMKAATEACTNSPLTTTLNVFVPDPSQG
ncbi:hypothetical protein MG296_00010 [Flavobacteriaceae bacterium TK19130]|nr:hypothetical protein [Thermobacterium salinum]